tara:strand:- start:679 stop:1515 length:837 start_codon:yes stop_codon:yes gene_type:complete
MPYVGRGLERGNYLKLDNIESGFNGITTAFNLTSGGSAFYPGSSYSLLVSLGGIIQEPEIGFTISSSTLTFAAAPVGSDDCFIVALGQSLGIGVPASGTVGDAELKENSVGDRELKNEITYTGILTASGANLTGITTTLTSAVGVQSGTTTIGVGVTTLKFVGAGNTFQYVSATDTVEISISSGAGGTWTAGSNNLGIHTTKLVGIATGTEPAGTATSEGALQAHGHVSIIDGALVTEQDIGQSLTIPTGKNGLLIGPVTVGAGVTIDVHTNSTLVVV